QQQQQFPAPVEGFASQGYTMPGMGGMMTPTPDGSYYYPQMPPGAVYYQPQ
ncbi:MAG: TerD family protein, partial [Terriglobus roseus]|nr:TerD family protein [Terriglobus roseus]